MHSAVIHQVIPLVISKLACREWGQGWLGSLLVLTIGCATSTGEKSRQILVEQDAYVRKLDQSEGTLIKAKTPLDRPDTPLLIEAPGYVATLIIPSQFEGESLTVSLKKLEAWSGDDLNFQVSKNVSKIIYQIQDIQKQSALGRPQDALFGIENLIKEFPNIPYLYFLQANLLFRSQKLGAAQEALEKGLVLDPENTAAKALLNRIRGKTS